MKILVAIASYGTGNATYLRRLIDEYRGMRFTVDIVVVSNIQKSLGPGIEVIVGLPSKDPWSLPFAHKKVFADRADHYDLFIYSEDDTLITERNICAFLKATEILPKDKIPGFLRSEVGPDGRKYYSTVHSHFHWEPSSVITFGNYSFAFFTNEHSACYLITREQLKEVIRSGNFVVGPHEGRYDLLVSAATDPYTQCGFRKMVCFSHLEDFTVQHLTNKYVGRIGVPAEELQQQIDALPKVARNGAPENPLFNPETMLLHGRWSKNYYEPCRNELVALVPRWARTVLSVGCGCGYTEAELVRKGMRVVGLPVDSVIAACAESRGVEIVYGDFKAVRTSLANERFDCVLMSDILHLVQDPTETLASFAEVLCPTGVVLVAVPNLAQISTMWRRFRKDRGFENLGSYEETGVHLTSRRVLFGWFRRCGLKVDRLTPIRPPRWNVAQRLSFGLLADLWASELVAVGSRV